MSEKPIAEDGGDLRPRSQWDKDVASVIARDDPKPMTADKGDVVERLADEIDEHISSHAGWDERSLAQIIERHISPLRTQLASARKALEPFAAVAQVMDFYVEESMPDMTYPRRECETRYPSEPRCVTLSQADFHAAAAALKDISE